MKKAFTLIELIFTILIIALVFTVIPKMILSLNKSDNFTLQQDALFNGISLMHMISNLSWDENNTNSNDILHTNSSCCDCNSSNDYYRVGGFKGSRSCKNNLHAGLIGNEGETNIIFYNDIDDFNNFERNSTNLLKYGFHVKVTYIDDILMYFNQEVNITLTKESNATKSTNLKLVHLNITYQGKRGKQDKQISQFYYTSANIGKMIFHKREWR